MSITQRVEKSPGQIDDFTANRHIHHSRVAPGDLACCLNGDTFVFLSISYL